MFELRHITAGYGAGNQVLHDISVSVGEGEVVALLGSNGSGKTTTLRVASRLLNPDSGSIWLSGTEVTRVKIEQLATLGVCHVPEGRGIFRSLTVEENLLVFAKNVDREPAVKEAIRAFPPLQNLMRRAAGTLSGGQQQMVALARAYICGAKVALLDEVSMGLAPVIVQEIFRFIPRLRDRGTSLLIVEQYVKQAMSLADRVYVLNNGVIALQGSPQELGRSPGLVDAYLGQGSAEAV